MPNNSQQSFSSGQVPELPFDFDILEKNENERDNVNETIIVPNSNQIEKKQELNSQNVTTSSTQQSSVLPPVPPKPNTDTQLQIQVAQTDTDILKIEKILNEEMDYIIEGMPEALRSNFCEKSKQTAIDINNLMTKATVNLKKIIKLIMHWLKTIPGINKFFLEQEAKIKADKILHEFNKNIEQ